MGPRASRRPWLALPAVDLISWAKTVVERVLLDWRVQEGWWEPAGELDSLHALLQEDRDIDRVELVVSCRAGMRQRQEIRGRFVDGRLEFERNERQGLASDLICRLGGMRLALWESPRPQFRGDFCMAAVLRGQSDAFAVGAEDFAAFTGSSEDEQPRWPGQLLREALWLVANRPSKLVPALALAYDH